MVSNKVQQRAERFQLMQRDGDTSKKQLTDIAGTTHLDMELPIQKACFKVSCNLQYAKSFGWLQPGLEAKMYLQGHTGSLVSLYASFYFLFLHHVNISMFKNMSFLAFELKSLLFHSGELVLEGRTRHVYFNPPIDRVPLQLLYNKLQLPK